MSTRFHPPGWVAIALITVGTPGQVAVWWRRTTVAMRNGLDTGQSVRVDHAPSGDISITDDTGQLCLPRGSALAHPQELLTAALSQPHIRAIVRMCLHSTMTTRSTPRR